MDQVSGIVRPKTVLAKPIDNMEEANEKPTKRQKLEPEAATRETVDAKPSPRELTLSNGTEYNTVSAEAPSQSTQVSISAISPAVAAPDASVVDPTRETSTVNLKRSTHSTVTSSDPEAVGRTFPEGAEEVVTSFVKLDPIPIRTPRVASLTQEETRELEAALEISPEAGNTWPGDWSGTLLLADTPILNPQVRLRDAGTFKQSLIQWAQKSEVNVRLLYGLMRYVYHLRKTPEAAKRLLASTDSSTSDALEKTIRRILYDPLVLRQDGWTTKPTATRIGASGGPVNIGTRVRSDDLDAVVIAYVHDSHYGDLFKAMWIDGDDYQTFDLEAHELEDAQRKWQRRHKEDGSKKDNSSRRSSRFAVSSDFTVDGIEHGIVLGASFSKGARHNVYWPARLAHASEDLGGVSRGKRTSSKQKVELVFLAPYWSSSEHGFRGHKSENGGFDSAPLLQVESVDATDEMIKEYPYDNQKEIDLSVLQTAFRFTGLPKSVFSRFIDSHRLAMGLKVYAQSQLRSKVSHTDRASAGLMETHPMSVQAPMFPPVILDLPFSYILSQLPRPTDEKFGRGSSGKGFKERVLQLKLILDSMKPPECWGGGRKKQKILASDAMEGQLGRKVDDSASSATLSSSHVTNGHHTALSLQSFTEELDNLEEALQLAVPQIQSVVRNVEFLLSDISKADRLGPGSYTEQRKWLLLSWIATKKHGEEVLSSLSIKDRLLVVHEWRQAAERVFRKLLTLISTQDTGDGTSVAISDPRCNEHRTSNGCMERPVRLPAALKGVRLAGVGSSSMGRLVLTVPDHYLDFVEQKLLAKAHSASYLHRMQMRCATALSDDQVVVLTDDSNGKGGEDTHGSTGTWKAAVAGVAAAIAGVDMIFQGECLNVFCATRPPGHHAGRNLHPMKAVSNGFCILNSVACAAIHAVSPVSEGGLGLSRVCVLDFDVHHGNGTQDILCSTYDPRFLYVSLHAGGPSINGSVVDNGTDAGFSSPGGKTPTSGIYPGRCGDSSPHKGVLNIPLGAKVTSHDVGVALLTRVKPAVLEFSPDLVILSAGFDAHKSDPMGLGGLLAEDFATITDIACSLANDSCSGRVLSVLEGGYGVPCCRPQRSVFLPLESDAQSKATAPTAVSATTSETSTPTNDSAGSQSTALFKPNADGSSTQATETKEKPQPRLKDLGEDLPAWMDDQVPYPLQRRLEKCHAEGFVECVQEHVQALLRWNCVDGPRKDSSTSD